jgi:hypothetical protein
VALICIMKINIALLTLLFSLTVNIILAGETPKSNGTKTILVSGVVTDPTNHELLAGVKIKCNTCEKTIYSDIDGRFMLILEINSNENLNIEFSQIGYLSKNLHIQDISSNSGTIEVNLAAE